MVVNCHSEEMASSFWRMWQIGKLASEINEEHGRELKSVKEKFHFNSSSKNLL
jgi:hypothetical protein